MTKFTPSLFLGLRVTPALREQVEAANPHLVSTFIQPGGEYLTPLEWEGAFFWGKSVALIEGIAALEQLEEHLCSLVQRLIPDFAKEEHSFVLFSVFSDP